MTIERKTIVLKGNIRIEGNASLTFRDSVLLVEQSYPQQFKLEVHDNAAFNIERVTVPELVKTWMNWEYYDSAKIYQTNFFHTATIWQVAHGANTFQLKNSSLTATFLSNSKAKLTATNSDYVWIEMGLPSGANYDFSLPNGRNKINWNSPDSLPYSIKIINSNIQSIDFDLSDDVNVVVRNSKKVKFGWVLGLGNWQGIRYIDTISRLKKQYYSDATFQAGSGARYSSVRLINSSLENWWPTVYGVNTLNLYDCSLADPRAYENSTVNIGNSTMTLFGSYQNSSVTIRNSIIDNFLYVMGNSMMNLIKVKFSGAVTKEPNAVLRRDGKLYSP